MEPARIRVLEDDLVNQIAAGEVVESPASVVKELIENALDAGADRIAIEIEGGGLACIRVSDNGHGMDIEDAVLAPQRHATSKIRQASDLTNIRTLGFRGEALPSIAAVSRLIIETRPAHAQAGTIVEVQEGAVSVRPCATAVGTRVTVRDLFQNVPARLKFQRGERSRLAAIRDLVARMALAWPTCHFTLLTGGHRALDLPACSRLYDRVVQVFGREVTDGLYEFSAESAVGKVFGVLGAPALARLDPGRVVILLGGRVISDPGLRRAVMNGYSVLIPEGRFPLAVVRVDLDPAEVDVNVHPRKTEVRFKDARAVQAAVFEAVRDAVVRNFWSGEPAGGQPQPSLMVGWAGGDDGSGWPAEGVREPASLALVEGPSARLEAAASGRFSRMRFVGQLARTVLVCEGEGNLVLIDQHAAHERVQFERLWKGVVSRQIPTESLLIPEVVPVSPLEASGLEEVVVLLAGVGFDLEPYSGGMIAVRAVPAILRGRAAAPVVRDCLSAAKAESDGTARLRKVVATVACHAAIRAGDLLGDEEAHALLQAMDDVALAAYCPHGRQAVVSYPIETVLRWFGR